ncbi:MAG: glycosyltransferase family protein [Gaiellaceae bacterium]
MRVLFLTTTSEDFHQDLVFHGLVMLLGRENVFDLPQLDRYVSPAPQDFRYQPMGYLDLPAGSHAGQSLEDLAFEADAVVVGALRGDGNRGLARLLELGIGRRPIVALDGYDDPYVRAAVAHVDVYFKRETLLRSRWLRARLPVRKRYHALRRRPEWVNPLRRQIAVASLDVDKVVPLPLGVVDRGAPSSEKKEYDVTFIGARTSPERAAVVTKLHELRAEGYRVCIPDDPAWSQHEWYEPTRIPWDEYMRLSSASRVCVNVRGLGYDTFRYWEIPYAGSLLLSEPARTVIPNNFVDGVEAVFGPASELHQIAKQLLEGDTETIAAAGREKLLKFHTSTARAQVVLDHLEALAAARSG